MKEEFQLIARPIWDKLKKDEKDAILKLAGLDSLIRMEENQLRPNPNGVKWNSIHKKSQRKVFEVMQEFDLI